MVRPQHSIPQVISAILAATGLWLYVSLTRTYEGDVLVPVVAIPPPGQSILSNVPKSVVVHVRTSGLNLVNLLYYNKPKACTLTVAKMRSIGPETYGIDNAELLRTLSEVVSSRMLSTVPSQLTITTGTPEVTKVPLTVMTNVSVRPGFVLSSPPTAEPSMVTLRGMKSIVQGIRSWSTKTAFIEDAHEVMIVEVPVSDSLMTLVDVIPKTVRVKIDVQRLADIVIPDVPVALVGAAAQSDVVVRPAYVHVTLRGGIQDIAHITRDNIAIEIASVPESGLATPTVRLANNARLVSVTPRFVQVVRKK